MRAVFSSPFPTLSSIFPQHRWSPICPRCVSLRWKSLLMLSKTLFKTKIHAEMAKIHVGSAFYEHYHVLTLGGGTTSQLQRIESWEVLSIHLYIGRTIAGNA